MFKFIRLTYATTMRVQGFQLVEVLLYGAKYTHFHFKQYPACMILTYVFL